MAIDYAAQEAKRRGVLVTGNDYIPAPRVLAAGAEFHVDDWWDRLGSGSWQHGDGNPACLQYAFRCGAAALPWDDEVLYGHVGTFGYLIHISEIEQS